MALIDAAELAPVQRLLATAASDTGQSRIAANFLPAWWNVESCGGFDLTDLWNVDEAIARDMVATAAFVRGPPRVPHRLHARAAVRGARRAVAARPAQGRQPWLT